MSASQESRSVLSTIAQALGSFWRATKTLIIIVLIVFFIASHLLTGLAVLTSNILGTIFHTTTALTDFRMQLNVSESALETTRADLADSQKKVTELEVESMSLRNDIDNLEAENKKLNTDKTVNFKGRRVPLHEAVDSTVDGLQNRTRNVATANLASAAGESIPFYGIAIIVGATTYELKSACDTMRDLHELQVAMDPESISDEDVKYVCGLEVPATEELWKLVKSSPGAAWESAIGAYDGSIEWVGNLEAPDFSGAWSRSMTWFSSWFE